MSSVIPVILGPTASGKTSVGIELAKLVNGEVISVDSRKVYQGLPVGTATPPGKKEESALVVEGVVHHLIDFLPLDKPYTAGDFAADGRRLIGEIRQRGRVPILVGGTGFYFKALQQGLPPLPKSDETFRKKLEQRIETEGLGKVRAELEEADPDAARHITSNDRHKIIRALEVLHLTGKPFSQWKDAKAPASDFQFAVMGLVYAKDFLDKRIEERSRHMLKDGMIEETQAALKKGYAPDCHALSSFGYREAVQVAQGRMSREEFLNDLIKGTKAYAKRQRTWFRTQVQPTWFSCDSKSKTADIALKMKAFYYTDRA